MFEKKSLGISFEADGTVRAAELVSGLRSVALGRTWSLEPEGTDRFDSWGRALNTLRESGIDLENAVIGIPDSLVYRKHLSFPFNNRKRIMQILNAELDGEIPLPVESVVADLIAGRSEGGGLQGIAVACDRDVLSRFLDMFGPGAKLKGVQTGSVGLAAASLRAGMVEGVTVHCSHREAVMVEFRSSRVKSFKRITLTGDEEGDAALLAEEIRQHTVNEDAVFLGCGSLNGHVSSEVAREATLNVRFLEDLEIVHGSSGFKEEVPGYAPAMGLALAALGAREAISFDLRQGPFRQETPLAGLKVPALRTTALLVVVGTLAMANLVVGVNQAREELEALRSRRAVEFKKLLPEARPIKHKETAELKGELAKLKKRMADLSGLEGQGALSILAALSAAIPQEVSLKLDELSYDSRKVRFEGSVNSFDTVDRIKAALDSTPLFKEVQVQNARVGADINKVTFRLQMEVR